MFYSRILCFLFMSGWILYGEQTHVDGFGRFGRINDDGLLTLIVSPQGFTTPPTRTKITANWSDIPLSVEVASISQTGKKLIVLNGDDKSPKEISYTLLYPGFSAIFGKKMSVKFSGTVSGNPIKFNAESPEKYQGFKGFYWVLITSVNVSTMPFVIAFRQGINPLGWNWDSSANIFSLSLENDIGEVRFITPRGMQALSSNINQEQKDILFSDCQAWAIRQIPIPSETTYSFSPDKKSIIINAKYKIQDGEMIAPIPPVLNFAHQNGYPVKFNGDVIVADCLTQQGKFAFIKGNTLSYELPVPPVEERGYLRMSTAPAERITLLNSLVGHLGGSWASNAVDLGYAGMSNAQMASVYLSPTTKTQVSNAWKTYLPLAFKMPPYGPSDTKKPWKIETEPFSKKEYIWTYFIDGWGGYRYDIEWGNALPLYGIYKYAQYTGDWEFVRKNWNAVKRIFEYIDYGDDYAWMTVVNGDHGYSTGTGDPMAAAYCGVVACLKMARAINDELAEEKFAYKAARICVPVVARLWYTKWARQNSFIGSKSVVLGFFETEGFTRAQLGVEDPWSTTNILSGDGILHELFLAFDAYAKDALQKYENEYAEYFPEWYNGNYQYPFNTTYNGNSVYVTFPHIFARAILGENSQRLWEYVDGAKTNLNNAWVGPNVIAELLSLDAPMYLTEWQPAAYQNGVVSADGKTATLDFELFAEKKWEMTARVKDGVSVKKVSLGGKEIPFIFNSQILTISQNLPKGKFQVVIEFNINR